jgi:general stress protein YciG
MANRNQGQNQGGTPRSGTSNRGFASMDRNQQREIARMGGEAVSGNREHMAMIGRKGGEASAESRANERARSARERTVEGTSAGTSANGGAPRDPGGRGIESEGYSRERSDRARGGEVGVGQRGLSARAQSEDEGAQTLGARGRDDDNRMLGARARDDDNRNLSGKSRSEGADTRGLSGRSRSDEDGGNRGLSGRGRDDEDRNSASRGNRGNDGSRNR